MIPTTGTADFASVNVRVCVPTNSGTIGPTGEFNDSIPHYPPSLRLCRFGFHRDRCSHCWTGVGGHQDDETRNKKLDESIEAEQGVAGAQWPSSQAGGAISLGRPIH